MQLLAELHEYDVGLPFVPATTFILRKNVRGIIHNERHEIALEFSANNPFYAIPGGGIEEGEPYIDTLHREMLEEIGCTITQPKEVGIVIDYANAITKMQISYCFYAKTASACGPRSLTHDEIEAGCEIHWMSLDQAIATIQQQYETILKRQLPDKKEQWPRAYFERFATKRDLIFLWEMKQLLKEK